MAKKQATRLSLDAINALRASSFEGSIFSLPPGHLDCYPEIKALMAALGGKWMGKKQHMAFADGVDCRALVMAACDRGEIPPSNPLDFFPTPPDIVTEIVSSTWLSERWDARVTICEMEKRPVRYLEPSGGSGTLAAAMAARMQPHDELVICELNPLLAAMLRTRFPRATVVECDFLEYTTEDKFDVILMNPPFDGKAYRKHVLHAESMLVRFGVLVSIVPSSFKTHGDDFLYNVASRGEWADLGGDRFESTNTATTAIFMENDPDRGWREKRRENYSTHHAWDAAMSIGNDGEMIRQLVRAANFTEAFGLIQSWATDMLRAGSCIRMDERIARETLSSVVEDYNVPELARLLMADDAEADEGAAVCRLPEPLFPVAAPSRSLTHVEQSEFALA